MTVHDLSQKVSFQVGSVLGFLSCPRFSCGLSKPVCHGVVLWLKWPSDIVFQVACYLLVTSPIETSKSHSCLKPDWMVLWSLGLSFRGPSLPLDSYQNTAPDALGWKPKSYTKRVVTLPEAHFHDLMKPLFSPFNLHYTALPGLLPPDLPLPTLFNLSHPLTDFFITDTPA